MLTNVRLSFKLSDRFIHPGETVEFLITANDEIGNLFVVKPVLLEFVNCEEGQEIDSTFKLNVRPSKLKDFIKGIQECIEMTGLSIETQSAGELKATKYHLEDMRKLAFVDEKDMVLRVKVEKPEEE